ncbi:hypothetical protein K438DRAFT_2082220 [Mycena galopus ATCC 62051]|nr:hypothetical protein K438DRAFT_2082220 [Mycena galopus ATCC 62051]
MLAVKCNRAHPRTRTMSALLEAQTSWSEMGVAWQSCCARDDGILDEYALEAERKHRLNAEVRLHAGEDESIVGAMRNMAVADINKNGKSGRSGAPALAPMGRGLQILARRVKVFVRFMYHHKTRSNGLDELLGALAGGLVAFIHPDQEQSPGVRPGTQASSDQWHGILEGSFSILEIEEIGQAIHLRFAKISERKGPSPEALEGKWLLYYFNHKFRSHITRQVEPSDIWGPAGC